MNALVLSGGSVKGSFQAGAISELLKAGFEQDAIYGVSVGSLNGAFLAERASSLTKEGRPDWPAIGRQLEEFWKNRIDSFDKIAQTKAGPTVLFETLFNDFEGLVDTGNLHTLVKDLIKEENLRKSPVKFSGASWMW